MFVDGVRVVTMGRERLVGVDVKGNAALATIGRSEGKVKERGHRYVQGVGGSRRWRRERVG